MKKYSCYIIDDMPSGVEQLQQYIAKTGRLSFAGSAYNPAAALQNIKSGKLNPDIIFLDIEMPQMSGIEFAKEVSGITKARIIFVTAYRKYAYDAFAVDAVDFILKPFDYTDFLSAVMKIENLNRATTDITNASFTFLKTQKGIVRFYFSNIVYLESARNYIKIMTTFGEHIALGTLAAIADKMPPGNFCQVHRSFVANLQHVEAINANSIQLHGNLTIPLGEKFKDDFFKQMRAIAPEGFPG